ELFRRDFSFVERIDGDAISGVVFFLTQRVGVGRHRRVEVFAVGAEGESEKICLVRTVVEASFWKIGERVRSHIENREGLVGMFAVFRVRSVSAVQKNDEAAIGRNCGSGGEIVDGARMAGHFAEQTSVGELSWSLRDCS